jgi:hypothetical protein
MRAAQLRRALFLVIINFELMAYLRVWAHLRTLKPVLDGSRRALASKIGKIV